MTILYFPLYALLWLLSRLPMRVLYAISDLFFLPVFYLIRYRRKLVQRQLADSFPKKTDAEYWCKITYADDIKVHFSQEVEGISDYKWFVEENEQMMQVIEKITNSDHCYVLDVQNFSYFNEVLMYDIDGDYYFVMRSTSGTIKKLYRLTEN